MKIEDALLDSVRVVAERVGVYRGVAEIVIERPVISVGSRLGGQLNDTRTGAPEFRGIGVGDELEFPYRIRVRQDCDLVERAARIGRPVEQDLSTTGPPAIHGKVGNCLRESSPTGTLFMELKPGRGTTPATSGAK